MRSQCGFKQKRKDSSPRTSACNWEAILDTGDPAPSSCAPLKAGDFYDMPEHSAVLFRETQARGEAEDRQEREVRREHEVELKHGRKQTV